MTEAEMMGISVKEYTLPPTAESDAEIITLQNNTVGVTYESEQTKKQVKRGDQKKASKVTRRGDIILPPADEHQFVVKSEKLLYILHFLQTAK